MLSLQLSIFEGSVRLLEVTNFLLCVYKSKLFLHCDNLCIVGVRTHIFIIFSNLELLLILLDVSDEFSIELVLMVVFVQS